MKLYILRHTAYYSQPQEDNEYTIYHDPVIFRTKRAALAHLEATKRPGFAPKEQCKADIRQWLEDDNVSVLYVVAVKEGLVSDYDHYNFRTAELKD